MPSRPVRVLHVYRTYYPDPPGGLQEAIRQICLATQAQGIANTIFTLSPTPYPRVLDYPEGRVVRSRSWLAPASCDIGGMDALVQFRRLARDADLIHYLFPWPFADVLHQTLSSDKPAVMTYISDIVRQRWLGSAYAPLMHRTLRSMRAIVANSPAYASTSPILSSPEICNKVSVIPLGIAEQHDQQSADHRIFERVGIDAGKPYILFIGVLRYYKGLNHLIEAAHLIRAPIVIAGSGPEGDALKRQAHQTGSGNIRFAGQVTDAEKRALLQHCRALVLPSHLRSEAYGMVLVEASMEGKPLVSCELGTGTSFVNLHGETGHVVPPANPCALADAINPLIHDAQLAARLGRAARARYERLFSDQALGRSYATLFRKHAHRDTGA